VVGPTAVGKSDLGVALARELGGEVVNADSMQLYRGMDIGTAKLTVDERQGVPHHLLDVLDVHEDATVAGYQALARAAIDDIAARGRLPLLVGGSGLYVSAVIDDLSFPGTDPEVRARLEAELATSGGAAMHTRLTERDPEAARAILPTHTRRVVRALEVGEITGGPYRAALPERGAHPVSIRIGLEAPRPLLDLRIAERVERMWSRGLVDEVGALADRGLREGRTAARALGYAQVLRMLRGECSEADAQAATIAATRRFVRRQESWFRRDPGIRWLAYDAPDLLDQALAVVASGAG
jgi:tRNA dimethylallyltransferase